MSCWREQHVLRMPATTIGGILFSGGKFTIPELSLENLHPKDTPIWPYMFITVAVASLLIVYLVFLMRKSKTTCK